MSCIRPATPGTVVVFAGTVLLVLVSVSVPLLKSIYFLKADVASYQVTLGTWGYCSQSNCSKATLGYSLDLAELFDYNGVNGVNFTQDVPNALVKGLTYVLVLHPAAAVFGAISVVLGLLAHIRGFGGTCWTTFFASLASSTAILAFIFDLALFIIAQKRINSSSVGGNAVLGSAIWMTLAGAILLMVSGCFFGCGGRMVRDRASRREASEKSKPVVDPQYGAHMRDTAYQHQNYASNGGNNLPKFAELRDNEAIPLNQIGHDKDDDDEDQPYNRDSYQDSPYNNRRDVSGGSTVMGVGQGYGRRNDGPVGAGTGLGGAQATSPTPPTRYNNGTPTNAGGYPAYPPPPRHPTTSPGPGGFRSTVEPFQSMSSPPPRSPQAQYAVPSPIAAIGHPQPYDYPQQQAPYASYDSQQQLYDPAPRPISAAGTGFNGPRDPNPVSNPYDQADLSQQRYSDPFAEGQSHQPYPVDQPPQPLYSQHTGPAPSYRTHQVEDYSNPPPNRGNGATQMMHTVHEAAPIDRYDDYNYQPATNLQYNQPRY